MSACRLMIRFGENLRSLRVRRGMTQQELGDLVGLSRAALSLAEKGRNGVSFRAIERLSEALGVTPPSLFR